MSIRFLNCKLLFPSEIKKKTVANTVRLCNYPSPCRIFESLTFKNCGFMNSQWIVPQTIILMLNLSQNRLVVGFFQAGSCVFVRCPPIHLSTSLHLGIARHAFPALDSSVLLSVNRPRSFSGGALLGVRTALWACAAVSSQQARQELHACTHTRVCMCTSTHESMCVLKYGHHL